MTQRILVSYASQGGSTAGIAKSIGQLLTERGLSVDILPVKEVTGISGYDGFVLGSAIHSGKWMPEMLAFIERNRSCLSQRPTAIFQVCLMLATQNETYKQMVPEWLNPVRQLIHPVASASFAGALQPNEYSKLTEKLGLHIFLATVKLKAGDYRNWDAIGSWTEQISPLLQHAS